jgi:nuclear pore complex protein Nup98-Nup96
LQIKGKENYLNCIFSLLSANRLLEACLLATDQRDMRLALLLSQCSGGGSTQVRNLIRKQIKEWNDSTSDTFLNADRVKLYSLISGELTCHLNSKSQFINVCEGLDWKRQFALHLW